MSIPLGHKLKIIKKINRKECFPFNPFNKFANIVNEIKSLLDKLEREGKPNTIDEISHKLNGIDDKIIENFCITYIGYILPIYPRSKELLRYLHSNVSLRMDFLYVNHERSS